LILKIPDPKPGVQNVIVRKSDVIFPDDISLEDIETGLVKVRIDKLQSYEESGSSK